MIRGRFDADYQCSSERMCYYCLRSAEILPQICFRHADQMPLLLIAYVGQTGDRGKVLNDVEEEEACGKLLREGKRMTKSSS